MASPSTLVLFSSAALLLLVIPGPSVLFIVTRSIDQGRTAGLVSVAGTHAGSVVHIAAAAAGLSALIVSSAIAFSVVKYVGAAYLVWLGVRRWRAGEREPAPDSSRTGSSSTVFRDGFVVSVLNPKTAIFFLAFLPQFVDVGRGNVTLQIFTLGLLFIVLGSISDSAYALGAAAIGDLVRRSLRTRRTERYLSSGVYVGLGVTTAVAGGHASPT